MHHSSIAYQRLIKQSMELLQRQSGDPIADSEFSKYKSIIRGSTRGHDNEKGSVS